MLRQVCREGQLRGILSSFMLLVGKVDVSRPLSRVIGRAAKLLLPDKQRASESSVPPLPTSGHSAKSLTPIPRGDYILILDFLNSPQSVVPIRHHADYPHPAQSRILYPSALRVTHTTHKTRTYSPYSIHPGNSSVSFAAAGGGTKTGFIYDIWAIDIGGERQEILLVSPHTPLSQEDRKRSPYTTRPGLMAEVVYDERHLPREDIGITAITKSMIQGHCPFLAHPSRTFGIGSPILVAVNSLHRFRL